MMGASSRYLDAQTTAVATVPFTTTASASVAAVVTCPEVDSSATLGYGELDDLAVSINSLDGSDVDTATGADTGTSSSDPRTNCGDSSCYWDASSMAPLNAQSVAAVARLRAYRSPAFPLWNRLPLSRRAAVLILLYADRHGDLRVVLTMRAASLRNYSGHAAFPGGKADTLDETPEQIARREAWEEIGLPLDGRGILPQQFRIEHLCSLPHNLAKTELVVRPCVALLTAERDTAEAERTEDLQSEDARSIDVERLIPRLDAKEVAAVFSAPFHNFLLATDELEQPEKDKVMAEASGKTQRLRPRLPSGPWYEGVWVDWHETPWRMHYFYVPVVGQRVAKPKKQLRSSSAGKAAPAQQQEASSGDYDDIEEAPGRYKVWGMTARILVDAAQLAYDERPEFEHNAHFGDERILEGLEQMGRLGEKLRKELTNKDAKDASKM